MITPPVTGYFGPSSIRKIADFGTKNRRLPIVIALSRPSLIRRRMVFVLTERRAAASPVVYANFSLSTRATSQPSFEGIS